MSREDQGLEDEGVSGETVPPEGDKSPPPSSPVPPPGMDTDSRDSLPPSHSPPAQPTAGTEILPREGSSNTVPLASSPPSTATKRPRRDPGAAGAGSRRMFSMLNATLGRAKSEAEKNRTDAEKRASTEARIQQKLHKERQAIEAAESTRRALRAECEKELSLVEQLLLGEAAHRSIRAQKRRLASFLVTSSNSNESAAGRDRRDRPHGSSGAGRVAIIAPFVPSSLGPLPKRSQQHKDWPVYFLPKLLTPDQEDILDEQEDRVDAEIEAADEEWEHKKVRLQEQLSQVRDAVSRIKERSREGDNGRDSSGKEDTRRTTTGEKATETINTS